LTILSIGLQCMLPGLPAVAAVIVLITSFYCSTDVHRVASF
jgi:hypothetical protein